MKQFFYIFIFTQLLALNAFAQSGRIAGRVFDAVTNEPLPFVNILVEGTMIGSTSDLEGRFILTGLEPGFRRLTASFVGYQTTYSDVIQVTNAKEAYVEIPLSQVSGTLEEVVVKPSVFRSKAESPVSLRTLSLSVIEGNPGANRDISKVITSLPGVANVSSFRNDIVIRGGNPGESRFYLDGVEIPNINHFATQGSSGGPVGILNADFIRGVDFYSGSFPASRGNALSAVFDFRQVNGNTEKTRFRGTVGASELAMTLDGPVSKSSSYLFSVRRSYLQFLFDALGLPFLPTFTDYQLKYRHRLNTKNEITVVSIGALDEFRLNTGLENPTDDQRYILDFLPVNEQWSYAIGTVYKHFSPRGFQTLTLSRNMLNNLSYKHPGNDESLPRIQDYTSQEIENKIRLENTVKAGQYDLNYGIGGEYAKYTNDTYQQVFAQGSGVVVPIDYSSFLELYKYSAFVQINRGFAGDRLLVSAGLRTDGNDYSVSMSNLADQLSPRLSASYAFGNQWFINANVGRYYQLPAYTILGYRNTDGQLVNRSNELRYIRADHYVAGIEWRPRENSRITLEAFSKQYDQYPFSLQDSISMANKGADFGVYGNEEVASIGKGRAYGLELFAELLAEQRYNLLFAYTWVRSEFTDKRGEYVPSAWDSRHIVTLTATRYLKRNINVGLKWRFLGGLPYTPFDAENSAVKEVWDTQKRAYPDYSRLNSERLKSFHQLDVRIDKKYFFPKWSLMLYLDIQNIYNYQIEGPDNLVLLLDEQGAPLTDPSDASKYMLKQVKNVSGTLLPTLGIMIEL